MKTKEITNNMDAQMIINIVEDELEGKYIRMKGGKKKKDE